MATKRRTPQKNRWVPSLEELCLSLEAAAAETGVKGLTRNKLKPTGVSTSLFEQALGELLRGGKLREFLGPHKSLRYVLTAGIPTQEQITAKLREGAMRYGAKGATAKQLGLTEVLEWKPSYEGAMQVLVREGDLVRTQTGKGVRYFPKGFAPKSAQEIFQEKVLEWVSGPEAWLEDVLLGKGKGAEERKDVLSRLVREGRLACMNVVMGAGNKKKARAYFLPSARHQAVAGDVELPEWPQIERTAKALAARRWDKSVSFEDVARELGVSPLFVKTAVLSQLEMQAPLQLVPGDVREIREPEVAGLDYRGQRYFRFWFLE